MGRVCAFVVTISAAVVMSATGNAAAQSSNHDYGPGILIWTPDHDPVDFGFGKGETSSNPGGVCPGVDAVDPLSRRAQSILKSWSSCPLYSAVAYDRFLAEVPRDRHYAVNYIAFVEGKPTLTPEQAEWWEREKSNLAYKPIQPGPDGIAPGRSNGTPTFTTARAPTPTDRTQRQPTPSITAAENQDVGACGVPFTTGLTAEAQVEADRIGTCDQIRQIFGG